MTAVLARRITPAAIAFYRTHPGTAGVAAYAVIGAFAVVGAAVGLGVAAVGLGFAVELEGWLQRRAAA